MKNADMPAMPTQATDKLIEMIATCDKDSVLDSFMETFGGLTKREHFAAMAMQGLIASDTPEWVGTPESQAEYAVKYADALLEELGK